ncbi:MAG: DUF3048 domain-containing protein [bacterium]|nr:DUF3048 domain-containing protein [bacterium]
MNKNIEKFNSRLPLFMIGVVILLGVLGYVYLLIKENKVVQFSSTIHDESYDTSILSGERMMTEKLALPKIVTVMVDNHPDAWPLSGLDQAKIVYEAPVEGMYTRFLAVFADYQIVAKVGPVRSARPYYLDWLGEYGDSLYMHCGGSPEALTRIKEEKVFDANEFYWGRFYWRDQARFAPHNLYTNSEKWNALLNEYGAKHANTTWQGWKFGELDQNVFNETVTALQLDYNYYGKINWVYDAGLGKYTRNRGSYNEFSDPVFADNVIIQYVKMRSIDNKDRKEIITVGSGEARVLRDGRMVRANWEKKSGERTRFYTKENKEILLRPGVTWVEILPNDLSVVITN